MKSTATDRQSAQPVVIDWVATQSERERRN